MIRAIAILLAITFMALPFVGMYWFASSSCVPAQHTDGFCPEWIAIGMVFPAFFELFIIICFVSVLEYRRDRK